MNKILMMSAIFILFSGSYNQANAVPTFGIEWLQDWSITPTSNTQGDKDKVIAESSADPPNLNYNTPTLKSKTYARGGGPGENSAHSEVSVSRSFRVTRSDPLDVSVQLSGDINGYAQLNVPGDAQVTAIAQVVKSGTTVDYQDTGCNSNAVLCDRSHRNPGSSDGKKKSATKHLTDTNDLTLGKNYIMNGNMYTHANSNHPGTNTATGTLDLRAPIQFENELDNSYYQVQWGNDWSFWGEENSHPNNEDMEKAVDLFSGLVADAVTGGFLAEAIADEVISQLLSTIFLNDTVEVGVFNDGVSMAFAQGINGGNAVVRLRSEREFEIVPLESAPAKLIFDGFLDGVLSSSLNTFSTLGLASVSVEGTGLEWSNSLTAAGGTEVTVDELIHATGYVVPYEIYTFEALLRTESLAYDLAAFEEEALADFSSSFGGNLLVEAAPVPEPSTIILFGVGLIGLLGLRKNYKI